MENIKPINEIKQLLESEEQMIHRLRNWSNGDVIYGVKSYNIANNPNYNISSGKTFTESDRERAVNMFESKNKIMSSKLFDCILFKAIIHNPKTEGSQTAESYTYEHKESGEKRTGYDAEPNLKFANLKNVEIIGRKVLDNNELVEKYSFDDY